MRSRIIAVVAACSVLLTAGVASASIDDTDSRIDTRFRFGYDAQTQMFFFNIQDSRLEVDCTADDGATGDDPITSEDNGDECTVTSIEVGVDGPFNHGQFMKAFNDAIDMRGRGCLNRLLAKSDLGTDATDGADPLADAADDVEFTTDVLTACNRDKKDDHPGKDGDTDSASSGQEKDRGRPDSPGKSDKAKGKNK